MKTLNLNEAAAFLRLHPHTLEAKARAGDIPGAKPGKCWVFIDVDLADWLRAQYRDKNDNKEATWRSTNAAPSIGASGRSAVRELERRLARPIAKPEVAYQSANIAKPCSASAESAARKLEKLLAKKPPCRKPHP